MRRRGKRSRVFVLDMGRDADGKRHQKWHAVGPSVTLREDGDLQQQWLGRSLSSSVGLMVLMDLPEGKVHVCANHGCNRIFWTDAWQGTYCSPRCRNTVLKRPSRKRLVAQNCSKKEHRPGKLRNA